MLCPLREEVPKTTPNDHSYFYWWEPKPLWNYNCMFHPLGWDSPIDFTGEPTVTWGLMPPEVFRPTEVPFDLPGKTEEILCPLPESYLKALAAKKR